MKRTPRQILWSVAKLLVAGLVVGFVGWQFTAILAQEGLWTGLHERPLTVHSGWMLASAGLYLAGLGTWGAFWVALVRQCGEPLPIFAGLRAYFVSQLGKYVPGKALVVLLRVGMTGRYGVRPAVAALTGVYETLTAMASGALVAAVLLPWAAGAGTDGLVWQALLLLALAGVPVLPGVFDRLAAKAARPFLPADAPPLPRPGIKMLLRGIAHGTVGWLLMGASLWAFLASIGLSPSGPLAWPRCTAAVAVAYVAGFLTLVSPGGLGVRELILQRLLTPWLADSVGGDAPAAALAVLAVLLVRLLWTSAEFAVAGLLYWLPTRDTRLVSSNPTDLAQRRNGSGSH